MTSVEWVYFKNKPGNAVEITAEMGTVSIVRYEHGIAEAPSWRLDVNPGGAREIGRLLIEAAEMTGYGQTEEQKERHEARRKHQQRAFEGRRE
jgi:hypothetical protein